MKKVAATSGHSVSLGFFVFAAEMTREGKWAGTDMLLNLYRRPPRRISWPALREFLRVRFGSIQGLYPQARKKCRCMNIFSIAGGGVTVEILRPDQIGQTDRTLDSQ